MHRTVLQKKCTSSNLQTCNFVVDPEHHILAWLMKVMHDDRKCILSVMICKPVITVQDKKKKQSSALVAEKNEIADQTVQLHRLICYFVVLIQLLMGFWRIMLHPN